MNVVASSGWLEYFGDGGNAGSFAPAFEGTERLLVPSISVFEVFRRLLAQRGEGDAPQAVAAMRQGRIVEPDLAIALAAAKLPLPLADAIILATARAQGATLWTQDGDFQGMDSGRYIAKA